MEMSWFDVFNMAQAIVMLIAALLLASLRLGFRTGKAVAQPEALARRLGEVEGRMDTAGSEMSDLATKVQALIGRVEETTALAKDDHDRIRMLNDFVNALPSTLSQTLLPRREADLLIQESRSDRTRLQREIDHLWAEIRRKR